MWETFVFQLHLSIHAAPMRGRSEVFVERIEEQKEGQGQS